MKHRLTHAEEVKGGKDSHHKERKHHSEKHEMPHHKKAHKAQKRGK